MTSGDTNDIRVWTICCLVLRFPGHSVEKIPLLTKIKRRFVSYLFLVFFFFYYLQYLIMISNGARIYRWWCRGEWSKRGYKLATRDSQPVEIIYWFNRSRSKRIIPNKVHGRNMKNEQK